MQSQTKEIQKSQQKKRADVKIGSTVYLVSNYADEYTKSAIKSKLIRLIKNEAAQAK